MPEQPPASPDEGGSSAAWRAVRNSSYALVEFAWPVAIALVVMPIVVQGLGPSAFGVLSLVAVTLGMFGLFDLGIGGAAMRAVAKHLAQGDLDAATRVLGTVVTTYVCIGLVGAIVIALATPFFVSELLAIPLELQAAATTAFYVSAIGFPVSLIVGAFASVPRAAQRFDLSTRVAVVFSTASPLATAALVVLGYGLPAIAAASLVINAIMGIVYYRLSRHLLAGRGIRMGIDTELLRELARFGGWFIVASFGVTILYQLDKLLLGSMLSVAAVTYYVVPAGLANRIQGALGAATQIVFPASSGLFARGRKDALAHLYRDATRLTFLLAAGLAVPMAVFAEPFLRYWMNPEFAERSSVPMMLLVATYMLLGLTGVVWGIGFGSGRAKVNALFVLGMGGLDVGLLLVLVGPYGITGASLAFLISAAIGVPAMISYIEHSIVGLSGGEFLFQYARVMPAVAVQVIGAVLLRVVAVNLVLTIAAMAATAIALPLVYLMLGLATPGDRALLDQLIDRVRPPRPTTRR